ncbi:Cell cycle checkpoint protein RAD1 [Armadillidium vulgare]|nr:Cell cycle checkpoint protein RAD1 [Armadillidium vulgare]
MSLSFQHDDENQNYILMAKIDNSKNVLHLMKAISFKDFATFYCSSNGLKVTVEDSKSVQANAFIQADMFQEYDIKEESITFKISLNALVECLNIFGSGSGPGVTTALKMCYNGYGFPLSLLLEEAGVITDCSLKTQDPDDPMEFSFCNTECLKEIFSELDMSSEVDIPKDSDVVESFSCTQTTRNRYKTTLMKPSIKPLAASLKVSIRTDNRGFLCLQFMIKTEDGHTCFVEYFCAPDEDYDD